MNPPLRAALAGSLLVGGATLVARAGLTLDIGIGRRIRPLGPIALDIAAPPEVVFDVVAAPYLGRTPRALRAKLDVIERGADLVLAAHFTRIAPGLTVTTVETVRFERPHRISFRLVKGPVPHVLEHYELQPVEGGTAFEYTGRARDGPVGARRLVGRSSGALLGADCRGVARGHPRRGGTTRGTSRPA